MAVFDTAFHQTMPPSAYMYAVPYEYHEKYHVRKYGFHGTSVKYLVGQARMSTQLCYTCSNALLTGVIQRKLAECKLGHIFEHPHVQTSAC